MLTLTNSAAAHLNQLLIEKPQSAVARIVRRSNRMRLHVGEVKVGDQKFSHDGRVVLALDADIAGSLSLRQLDIHETTKGPRLRLRNRF